MELKNQKIDLAKLAASHINVRAMGKTKEVQKLAGSIAANGLIQPLTVYKSGDVYEVDAGARRLAALKLLSERGEWSEPVACRVIPATTSEGDRKAISFAENDGQLPMHPLDRLRVLSNFTKQGMSAEEIGARFGIEQAEIERTMTLQRLALPIRAAAVAGEIPMAHAFAYAKTTDQTAQMAVFEAVSPHTSASVIRSRLGKAQKHQRAPMRASDRFVKAIGLDAYEEAGGKVICDLFTDPEHGLVDGELVVRLLKDAMNARAAEIVAKHGGKVVQLLNGDYSDDLEYWDGEPGDCPVTLWHGVSVNSYAGIITDGPFVRSDELEAWEAKQRAEAAPEDLTHDAEGHAMTEAEPEVDPESQTKPPSRPMLADCADALTRVLRARVSADTGLAFDYLLHAMIDQAPGMRVNDATCISARLPISDHEGLQVLERLPDTVTFEDVRALQPEDKLTLIAALTAGMVTAAKSDFMGHPDAKPRAGAVQLGELTSVNMHNDWSDAERIAYLGRMSKADLCKVMQLDDDAQAAAMKQDKAELVERAAQTRWVPPYFEGLDADEQIPLAIAAE